MRFIKLSNIPSEQTTAQPGDLIPDVWYKGKEFKIKQDQVEQHIKMKNIEYSVLLAQARAHRATSSLRSTDWNTSRPATCCVMKSRKARNWARRLKATLIRDSSSPMS